MSVTMSPAMGRPRKKEKTSHVRVYESDSFRLAIVARVNDMDVADAFEHFFGKVLDREYTKALEVLEARKSRQA